jgi:hypothetical protein
LLTGGASDAVIREDDWLALHAARPVKDGWRHVYSVTYEDTVRFAYLDQRVNCSAAGWDANTYYDRASDGYVRIRSAVRTIDAETRDAVDHDALRLSTDSTTAFFASPELGPWRVGLDVSRLKVRGHGTTTTLSGVFGASPDPGLAVEVDQVHAAGRLERRFGPGGVFLEPGMIWDRSQVTVYDDHVQRIPLDYTGSSLQAGGWLNWGEATVEAMVLTAAAGGTDTLVYEGGSNGSLTGRQHARQLLLGVQTPRTRWHLSHGEFSQRREGYGIEPGSSGWTAVVDGNWRIRDTFADVSVIKPRAKGRQLIIDYGLHRIRLSAAGAFRGGYLGGLLETDRGSGSKDRQAWLHDLAVEYSLPIRAGRLGYRARLTVPLFDHHRKAAPPPPGEDERVGGGLTHTLYWDLPI